MPVEETTVNVELGSGGNNGQGPSQNASGGAVNKSLMGMLMFIGTEVMFFGGLISVFLILRANNITWPPPFQPRLPVGITGINTVVLLLSGAAMFLALRAIRRGNVRLTSRWLSVTAFLGATFLSVQGYEWVRLIAHGLTVTSSIYGAIFYAVIGCHALHVLGAMVGLLLVLRKSLAQAYTATAYTGLELCSMYWHFVVGIWPVLYVLVYLS